MKDALVAENRAVTWSLRERTSGFDSAVVDVTTGSAVIGRRTDCDIVVADRTVSSAHAELSCIANDLMVTDLGSTNGTYVNGRQLTRPEFLRQGDTLQFGTVVFQVRREIIQDEGATNFEMFNAVSEIALRERASRAIRDLRDDDLEVWFQPLVNIADQKIVAQELLTRCSKQGLETAGKLFRAAESVGKAGIVSEKCRRLGTAAASQLDQRLLYFVNTHPDEFRSQRLVPSIEDLRATFPDVRLVLEIHEQAMTNRVSMQELAFRMLELDVELAYDDFGSGSSRILEILEVPPAYVKFDIEFIRSVCSGEMKRSHAISLLEALRQMDVCLVAEGIESEEQHLKCLELGFQLGQGYFYARPACVSDVTDPAC